MIGAECRHDSLRNRPLLAPQVGPDSKASPFVGMLPTPLREWIVRKSMYKM